MAVTPDFNLPYPEPNSTANVPRDFKALAEAIEAAMKALGVDVLDVFDSTDKTLPPSADALRRGLETKQNILRLADNYLAASVLVNAAPDGSGRSYPDGVSMFKVSSSTDGWPTANGYVLTFRAGSGGYQIFYEMYTGAVQTDKTARQWTRSKRDSNGFWQDWARGLTEVDLDDTLTSTSKSKAATADALRRVNDAKMDANRPSNLVPNGSGTAGLTGWTVMVGGTDWITELGRRDHPAHILYNAAPPTGLDAYLQVSIPVVAGSTYNISAEFYAVGFAAGKLFVDIVSANTNANLGRLQCGAGDNWARRDIDVAIPGNTDTLWIRPAIAVGTAAGTKGFRKIQTTQGAGVKAWNDDADGIALFTSVVNGKASLEPPINAKGGTVLKAGSVATFAELVAGVNSIVLGYKAAPGEVLLYNFGVSGNNPNPTYTRQMFMRTNVPGTFRLRYTVSNSGSGLGYARVYKNGVAYGVERVLNPGSPTTVAYVEDLTFAAGDTIEFWTRAQTTNSNNVSITDARALGTTAIFTST